MEIIKENVRASQFVGHESLLELVEGDIIVPDIKPDILSLVKVEGRPFITNREVQDDKVRIQGMIDIYAIYIADDETNSLKGLTATLNFNENIDMKGCNGDMIPILKFNLSNVESRVLNGRKITVKCPLEIDLKVISDSEFDIPKDVADLENVQMLKENMRLNSLVGHNTETLSINENVSLSENLPPIGEILTCSLEIVNQDYKVSYNKVLAKADARVRIVYSADDEMGSINVFETFIPFTGFIDINGVNENTKFDIGYTLKNYCIKPIYQDMKASAISVEAEIDVMVIAHEEKEFTVIRDLYNPDNILKYDEKSIALEQMKDNRITNIKFDQMLQIPELDNSKLLEINITPTITEKKNMEDKIIVDGNVNVDIMFYKLDKGTIETKRIDIPFEQSVAKENKQDDITVQVSDIEYELAPSGNLKLNMTLNFENEVMDTININMIDNLEATGEKAKSPASVVVYPVKSGDSLWSIAKKFGTTIDNIKTANDLSDDMIYPMQQLIIPRRVYRLTLDPLN